MKVRSQFSLSLSLPTFATIITGLCRAAERAFFFSGEREGRSREGGRSGLYGRLCTLKEEGNEPWMGMRISNPSFEVIIVCCRTKLLGTGK